MKALTDTALPGDANRSDGSGMVVGINQPPGSDWPGGLPGDSRWAGGHQKLLYQLDIQSSVARWRKDLAIAAEFRKLLRCW